MRVHGADRRRSHARRGPIQHHPGAPVFRIRSFLERVLSPCNWPMGHATIWHFPQHSSILANRGTTPACGRTLLRNVFDILDRFGCSGVCVPVLPKEGHRAGVDWITSAIGIIHEPWRAIIERRRSLWPPSVKARAALADNDDFAKVCRIRHVYSSCDFFQRRFKLKLGVVKLSRPTRDHAKRTAQSANEARVPCAMPAVQITEIEPPAKPPGSLQPIGVGRLLHLFAARQMQPAGDNVNLKGACSPTRPVTHGDCEDKYSRAVQR